MVKFVRFPFALSGDRAPVPDDADPSGAVSYAQGFGPDYELELGVDPGAKPVPRPETNQLYYDLSDNQRHYQLNGAPPWFAPSANNGVAISYPVNAIVRHNDLVYRSIAATNTAEPGTDVTKWVVDGVAGPASTTDAGLVRYATPAEAAARVLNDRAVTPAGLGALYALFLSLPIYPEVLNTGGVFTLTNPANNVRVAAGTQWLHRGYNPYTSVQTDLPTVASKTYHLRWTPQAGFGLFDLSSGAYNPSAVPETDAAFDSTYDNMLIARVVTNAGNAATITPLANKADLAVTIAQQATMVNPGAQASRGSFAFPLGWARTPRQSSFLLTQRDFVDGSNDNDLAVFPPGGNTAVIAVPVTRYSSAFDYRVDYSTALALHASFGA